MNRRRTGRLRPWHGARSAHSPTRSQRRTWAATSVRSDWKLFHADRRHGRRPTPQSSWPQTGGSWIITSGVGTPEVRLRSVKMCVFGLRPEPHLRDIEARRRQAGLAWPAHLRHASSAPSSRSAGMAVASLSRCAISNDQVTAAEEHQMHAPVRPRQVEPHVEDRDARHAARPRARNPRSRSPGDRGRSQAPAPSAATPDAHRCAPGKTA